MLTVFGATSAAALRDAIATPIEPAPFEFEAPDVTSPTQEFAAVEATPGTFVSGGGADDIIGTLPALEGPPAQGFEWFSAAEAPLLSVERKPSTDMVAHGETIVGTTHGERLEGTDYADGIAGLEGADFLYGNAGGDVLNGGDGSDVLVGGRGDDFLYGGKGDDVFDAPLFDTSGGGASGADTMDGGDGNDFYFVDDAGDQVWESRGYGNDTVITSLGEHTLAANVENLASETGTSFHGVGNDLDNTITSMSGNDTLEGGAGNDTLRSDSSATGHLQTSSDDVLDGGIGNDRLEAGDGADTLIGGEGQDTMLGGAGADIFRIGDGDSGIDIVVDFEADEGDRIDLSGMSDVESFDDLSITMTTTGAIVSFGESAVMLVGVTDTSLSEDMFVFG